jgi:uncharacterized protein YbaP (TraB family)
MRSFVCRSLLVFALAIGGGALRIEAKCCVWMVTGPHGETLFLGGSVHALRSTDYPLPAAYNRAFDASSRLVLEDDPKDASAEFKRLFKAGRYSRGDSLKNHVDPRTYAYVRRFFALLNVPEKEFATFRPWLIDVILESPPEEYYNLGVEEFLVRRARANSKPISGLESAKEHTQVYVGLNDRQGEEVLLLFFIQLGHGDDSGGNNMLKAWRRGDAEWLARQFHNSYSDLPFFGRRLVDERNRNWIPKIESYLASGRTYFVVVGAAHMGGPRGVLALLKARGYRIEQL